MPIYDYRCEACGHRFEKMVKLADPAPPCPECQGEVRKLVSPVAFQLKGSGWYRDHYGLKKSSDSGSSSSDGGGKRAAAGGDS